MATLCMRAYADVSVLKIYTQTFPASLQCSLSCAKFKENCSELKKEKKMKTSKFNRTSELFHEQQQNMEAK